MSNIIWINLLFIIYILCIACFIRKFSKYLNTLIIFGLLIVIGVVYPQRAVLYLIATYLISSIPFGLFLCKFCKNIDIRTQGSGNIGATNVARVCGFQMAIPVFILDGLKSFLPVLIAKQLFISDFIPVVLFTAVIGHIFSIWLKGNGGKGVASTIFGLFALDYRLGLIVSIAWLIMFKLTKISAVAALSSIFIVSICSLFIDGLNTYIVFSIMAIIIFWAHRENIKRLLSQKELGFDNGDKQNKQQKNIVDIINKLLNKFKKKTN